MFNPNDERSYKRLYKSLKQSRKAMESARRFAHEHRKEYVGSRYSDEGTAADRPLNMIELAYTITQQNLVATAPRVSVMPRRPEHLAEAKSRELAINQHLKESNLQSELELWVMESMFAPLGVVKLALDMSQAVNVEGMPVYAGLPTVTTVLLEDLVLDMRAKSPEAAAYVGDRYQVERDWAMESGAFDPELLARLPKHSEEEEEEYAAKSLSMQKGDVSDYRDMLELWDVWLPDEGLVLTLHGDFENLPPLRVVEWDGPQRGPYHYLYFAPVAGNALPLPPVSLWFPLHRTINIMANKLSDQAERQKSLTLVDAATKDDLPEIQKARDGDGLVMQGLNGVVQAPFGGINQPNFVALMQYRQMFSYQNGNLDAMGGLAPMSSTLGQDQLLSESASQRLQKMQAKVYWATQGLCEDISWYLDADPTLEIPIEKQVGDLTIHSAWSAAESSGRDMFKTTVEPFSMQTRTPQQRLANAQAFWRNDVLPAAPLLVQTGTVPNPESYFKLTAKLLDQPELSEFVTYTMGETEPPVEPMGSSNSTSTNVRVNKSTRTPSGTANAMTQNMPLDMGAAPVAQKAMMGVG